VLRRLRPQFRPSLPAYEQQDGVEIYRPRFLSIPGYFKQWDGFLMALGSWSTVRRLKKAQRCDIVDAHFGYPDGYAAELLGRWLKRPITITMRGTETRHVRTPALRKRLRAALLGATRVFAVAEALKSVAVALDLPPDRIVVIGNGIDTEKFRMLDRSAARAALDLPDDAVVLVSVGGLCERKGFHRVIECMPELMRARPNLFYLIVGGPSPEGDWRKHLEDIVSRRGLQANVRFLGPMLPNDLKLPLSAANVFVLATRNEGWANVLLEAMACGIPVVTTDVGGNREVVSARFLGTVVPFGNREALGAALEDAITRSWDRERIVEYARQNSWERRISCLLREFEGIHAVARESLADKCNA
jgi:glycosyltransferase involved in cell wall biosynthesis